MKKAIIIVLVLAMLGVTGCSLIFKAPDESIEFSREVWDEAWDGNVRVRSTMLDDLLEKYDFIGMSKDEVLELLGTNGVLIGEESLGYETGGGYFSDEILSFSIDENGVVRNVGIAN